MALLSGLRFGRWVGSTGLLLQPAELLPAAAQDSSVWQSAEHQPTPGDSAPPKSPLARQEHRGLPEGSSAPQPAPFLAQRL